MPEASLLDEKLSGGEGQRCLEKRFQKTNQNKMGNMGRLLACLRMLVPQEALGPETCLPTVGRVLLNDEIIPTGMCSAWLHGCTQKPNRDASADVHRPTQRPVLSTVLHSGLLFIPACPALHCGLWLQCSVSLFI